MGSMQCTSLSFFPSAVTIINFSFKDSNIILPLVASSIQTTIATKTKVSSEKIAALTRWSNQNRPAPILDGGAREQREGAVVPIPDAGSLVVIRGVHQAHTRTAQYAAWDKQKVRAPIHVLHIMHVTDIAQVQKR